MTVTVTFPDEMRAVLEARAKARGYSGVDEYIRDTVELDDEELPELTPEMRARIAELAEQGRHSPPIPDPWGFLDELVRRTSSGLPVRDAGV